MMLSKKLQLLLFGNTDKITVDKDPRGTTINVPSAEDGERPMNIRFKTHDGLVYYLVKRIIALEDKMEQINKKETEGTISFDLTPKQKK